MKNILSGLKFIFFSRGLLKGIDRLQLVRKRFGFSARKQIDHINYYASLLRELNIKATFFIPATILDRHIEEMKRIENTNIEWGIHGYTHTDLSKLSFEEQKKQVNKAIEVFDKRRIAFSGFRAPYLRTNTYTVEVIAETARFLYASTNTLLWDDEYTERGACFKWIKRFYRPHLYSQTPSLPKEVSSTLEISVTLPDDDVLLDREKLDAQSILSIWKKILWSCHKKDELFVLQLHPERIQELKNTLTGLIKEAKALNPPVWIANLSQIAKQLKPNMTYGQRWPLGYKGALAITGDIDCLSMVDFIIRLKEW